MTPTFVHTTFLGVVIGDCGYYINMDSHVDVLEEESHSKERKREKRAVVALVRSETERVGDEQNNKQKHVKERERESDYIYIYNVYVSLRFSLLF